MTPFDILKASAASTAEPTPIDSLSTALMQICGTQLVRKRWRPHSLNGTWEVVKLPPGKHAIGSRWFLNVKYNADGSLDPL